MTARKEIEILGKEISELTELSKQMLLSFSEEELECIQKYYDKLGRNPTDIELETIAQTWSEHCKHKTFNSAIDYTEVSLDGSDRKKHYKNMFKETIVQATKEIGERKKDFLVSVFSDNAGIIKFDNEYGVAFKVETHNHPSALEPYGGANTGIGGVIRDILGVGLGAKPIANTDIFCFGMPDTPESELPESILHPKRIARGVRAGVRDYGNRMGIPTLNGAIIFEERYLGNPLVYCGTIGIIPAGLEIKQAKKDDFIVAIGGRTGRDGIHGATFASVELEETTPSSPVQIGNPIEEKKVTDVLLQAREEGLYNAVTDCGAGGFSSAVGEMGEELGAEVELVRAPLKYAGLLPWEIWISEAQERMVLSVPEKKLKRLEEICLEEDVEVTVLGRFTDDKILTLKYDEEIVGQLEMDFLHNGVPQLIRKAEWKEKEFEVPDFEIPEDLGKELLDLLGMPNIASKETTIRQYDHEVQGGVIGKPLVGLENDGPADAAVLRPLFTSWKGVVVSNGINPLYGDIDPYWMAASAIDEAIRNAIAAGAEFSKIALLDNFSWGNPQDPEKLAGLVRASQACHDFSLAFNVPFISGKDSLYNEYKIRDETIAIPGTLLISAMGIMEDCRKRVTIDAKTEGNSLYIVGKTYNELGGSHYFLRKGVLSRDVPEVRHEEAGKIFESLSSVVKNNREIIASIHDCSEGGIGVAAAEMGFSGGKGISISLDEIPADGEIREDFILFSESNSRFLVEVVKGKEQEFETAMKDCEVKKIGEINDSGLLQIVKAGKDLVKINMDELKIAWKQTLYW